MSITKVNRALIQPNGELNATTLGGKSAADFLPTTHPSAGFSNSGTDGRVKHNGSDVKVLNAVNAETSTNSTKWADKQFRVGSYDSGAAGFITFGY